MKTPKERELSWFNLVGVYLLVILACIGVLTLFAEPESGADRGAITAPPEDRPVNP
jgi:hypothetical protein